MQAPCTNHWIVHEQEKIYNPCTYTCTYQHFRESVSRIAALPRDHTTQQMHRDAKNTLNIPDMTHGCVEKSSKEDVSEIKKSPIQRFPGKKTLRGALGRILIYWFLLYRFFFSFFFLTVFRTRPESVQMNSRDLLPCIV